MLKKISHHPSKKMVKKLGMVTVISQCLWCTTRQKRPPVWWCGMSCPLVIECTLQLSYLYQHMDVFVIVTLGYNSACALFQHRVAFLHSSLQVFAVHLLAWWHQEIMSWQADLCNQSEVFVNQPDMQMWLTQLHCDCTWLAHNVLDSLQDHLANKSVMGPST